MSNCYILSSGRRSDQFGRAIPGHPVDWLEDLLDAGVWGGKEDTPNFMELQPGDRVVFQARDAGFVATATVDSNPHRTRMGILRERNCTHEIHLRTIRRFRTPVERTTALRKQISKADGDTPRRTQWGMYFAQSIKPISRAVFSIITKR